MQHRSEIDTMAQFFDNLIGVIQFKGDVMADGENGGVLDLDVEL